MYIERGEFLEQFVYTNEGRVLLRENKSEDVSKIYEMYQSCDPEQGWWDSQELNQFRFDLIKESQGRIFVAVLNDQIIGHAEVILPEAKDEPVYLVRLEIHDDFRRRKFGIELVRYSAIIMKNLGYTGYVTWPDTNKSKGLYKKVGLKEVEKNPQFSVKISGKREVDIQKIEELSFENRPLELEIAVGCPWARKYTWIKAFKAAKEELFDYQGPYVHKVEVNGIESVILLDGHSLYIYLPSDNLKDVKIIEKILIYSSNLALDNKIEELHINIKQNLWDQIDLSDIWEVEEIEERLEMKMDF